MPQNIFDEQINTLLTPYVGAGDVALSVIVDPPPDLPRFRKANCAVLNTTALTLTKHGSDGTEEKVIDLAADEALELAQAAKDAADAAQADIRTNTGKINVLEGVTAATDAALAATDVIVAKDGKQIRKNRRHIDEIYPVVFDTEGVAADAKRMAESADIRSRENADVFDEYTEKNDKNISTLQQNVYSQAHRLDLVENKATKNKTLIDANRVLINEDLEPRLAAAEGLAGENEGNIIELQGDLSTVKTTADTAKGTAEAADTLSKANKKELEVVGGAIDGLSSLTEDHTADIAKNKSSIEALDSAAVKEGGDPVFATVTTDRIDAELVLHLAVGNVITCGLYSDHANFANASYVTGNMRAEGLRQDGDFVTWGVLKSIVPSDSTHIKHGDDAVLNSLDMGHGNTAGFIKNVKDAELDGDAVNLGQLKSMLDAIFTSEIDLHDNNIQHVGNINGRNARTTQINNVKRVRSDMSTSLDSLSFSAGETLIHSKKFRVVDEAEIDLMTVEKDAGIHFKKGVKFHGNADLNGHNLNNVKGIGGNSARALSINHVGKIRSRADGQDGESVTFVDGGIDFKAKNYHFKDNGDADKVVIGESHTHFKGQDVQFHEAVSFDKNATFGVNAQVSINNALNMNGHSITNVRTANEDHKATNLGHIKQLIAEGAADGADDVLSVDDLTWTPVSQDFRGNTKKIIDAMPKNSVVVGRHDKTTSPQNAKYNIINKGSSGATSPEPQSMVYQITKDASGLATGFATASSGMSTVVRFLTGANYDWASMTAVNAFSLPEDEHADSPEGHIYLTDEGIKVAEHNEETGETEIKALDGYNSPQLTQDVAQHTVDLEELRNENELGKSRTEHFKNESKVSFPFTDPDHTPIVDCYLLATNEVLTDSYIDLTDDTTLKYSGRYNTVGVTSISGGVWSVSYAYHNAYKHISEDWYIVFSLDHLKWCLIEAANLHTEIGSTAASVVIELGERSSLPETHNGYILDVNFEDIESLNFTQADKSVIKTDLDNKRILLDFGQAKVSGFIVIK